MEDMIRLLFATYRSLVIEITDEDADYETNEYELLLDGEPLRRTAKTIETVRDLEPDREYELRIRRGGRVSAPLAARTAREFVTLNVRDFGAHGDGVTDDTQYIQAAILTCPAGGRVLIPEGVFKFTSLFLKSGLTLELGRGAVLSAIPDRSRLPILPGRIESWDEKGEFLPGTWEGDPLDSYVGLLTGMYVEDVTVCGEGTLDGGGDFSTWWDRSLNAIYPARPRAMFFNHCRNVTVTGITVRNSPAWNLHPYFSRHVRFYDLHICSPHDSMNTDGIDPESCADVEIAGVHFSVGDDCVAIKSGKYYMGRTYGVPSTDIRVRNCLMERGHGGVTIGSEIAAGVDRITVSHCHFVETDRGLRVKTRRGRGKDSYLRGIVFDTVRMDGVRSAFVINSFYYCGPDGKSDYVADKRPLPVDDRTPRVGSVEIRNVDCRDCHAAGIFFYGLPESKIENVLMENVSISFADDPQPAIPAMMTGCEPQSGKGVFIRNAQAVTLRNVRVTGSHGDPLDIENVDHLDWL